MKPVILKDVLSFEHCELLRKRFLQTIKNNERYVKFKDESEIISNTKALYDPYVHFKFHLIMDVDQFFTNLTQKVTKIFQKNIEFKNSYLRMYKNGSNLSLHSDRHELDITLSVNVGGLENWPLHISNLFTDEHFGFWKKDITKDYQKFKEDFNSYYTPKGTGVVCYGNYPHWRDELICEENEYVMQIFFHWKILS